MSLHMNMTELEFNDTLDKHFEVLDLSAALFYSANKLDDYVMKDGKIAFSAHGNRAYKYFVSVGRELLRHLLYMSSAGDNWIIDFYEFDGQINIWQKYKPANKYTLAVIDNHSGNIFEEFRGGLNALLLFDFEKNLWSDDSHESTDIEEEINN